MDWHFDFVVEGASKEQAEKLVDQIIDLAEEMGLTMGGGCHSEEVVSSDELGEWAGWFTHKGGG